MVLVFLMTTADVEPIFHSEPAPSKAVTALLIATETAGDMALPSVLSSTVCEL